MPASLRPLADTGLSVTSVALGCWPIAGITSVGVTPEQSRRTIRAALDAGVNFFDTAHAYGYDGESERLLGDVLKPVRDEVVIASKCGLVWGETAEGSSAKRPQSKDGRPETIRRQCDESLRRLAVDRIDLYYLHAPDPEVPIKESAGALRDLVDAGKVRSVGVSNLQAEQQYTDFAAECPFAADQVPYNMLQRDAEKDRFVWAKSHGRPQILVTVYWPLMKGLLAGGIRRDHVFEEGDSRPSYPVFREPAWTRTHDFLDRLRELASGLGITVAQLVVAWTAARAGVGSVLCGAKRPEQISETAAAASIRLSDDVIAAVDSAIEARGPIEK